MIPSTPTCRGTEGTDSFTIHQHRQPALTFSISMTNWPREPPATCCKRLPLRRRASREHLTDASSYLPGTTVDWTFTATNASTDVERLETDRQLPRRDR